MNDFFLSAASTYNIRQYECLTIDIQQFQDPLLRANTMYKNYPSIRAIYIWEYIKARY